jgi:hypothetical protein
VNYRNERCLLNSTFFFSNGINRQVLLNLQVKRKKTAFLMLDEDPIFLGIIQQLLHEVDKIDASVELA